MTTKRKFKSDAFEAIHSSASALHRVGAIHETAMRKFGMTCITDSESGSLNHIEKIREQ